MKKSQDSYNTMESYNGEYKYKGFWIISPAKGEWSIIPDTENDNTIDYFKSYCDPGLNTLAKIRKYIDINYNILELFVIVADNNETEPLKQIASQLRKLGENHEIN
jgi:hypothetical protein